MKKIHISKQAIWFLLIGVMVFFIVSSIRNRQDFKEGFSEGYKGVSSRSAKTENLVAFAKAYGYVKYFHPSDEASNLNWQKFSALGAREVIKCKSKKELFGILNYLFNPVAPGVKFYPSGNVPEYSTNNLIPADTQGYRITYWQHLGVDFDIHQPASRVNLYRSTRVNRTDSDTALFSGRPEFGKILRKEIGRGISCYIPLALYCDDESVYPASNPELVAKLKADLTALDYSTDEMSMRLGNVIYVYNIFKHFYPYFDVVQVDWDAEFRKALGKTFKDKSPNDHLRTLKLFTAALKDGHAWVNYSQTKSYYALPVRWEWIEGKLVITKLFDSIPDLNVGDVVTEINGEAPEKYFENINALISAPTKGWLNYTAGFQSLLGELNSQVNIVVNNKAIELARKSRAANYKGFSEFNTNPGYMKVNERTWYLNMDIIAMDTINKLMPALENCDAIICDARGYPNGNHELLTHFMNIDDTTCNWMQIPQIIYPDYEKVTYLKANWIRQMKAQKPFLGDKKIVYITDGSAISYAESCLGYVEGYKLATIVGQPSAGTNGNVNPFTLPGGYIISWTGMKVQKHNGTQHHGIGIIPHVYVEKTIRGVKEGRDEFLEKAIEIASL